MARHMDGLCQQIVCIWVGLHASMFWALCSQNPIKLCRSTPHIHAEPCDGLGWLQVGPEDHIICALSGGVDSTVAATLVHKVVGDRLHCVFVDNGLLRYKVRE